MDLADIRFIDLFKKVILKFIYFYALFFNVIFIILNVLGKTIIFFLQGIIYKIWHHICSFIL